MNTKQIFSVAFSVATIVLFLGALIHIPKVQAQSPVELQGQINKLIGQVLQLQRQLDAVERGEISFDRNLTVGSRGNDVKALQQWLNSKSFIVAQTGAGSPGNETTYFGPATRAALAKWQTGNGVSPAIGYFGPLTRSRITGLSVPESTALSIKNKLDGYKWSWYCFDYEEQFIVWKENIDQIKELGSYWLVYTVGSKNGRERDTDEASRLLVVLDKNYEVKQVLHGKQIPTVPVINEDPGTKSVFIIRPTDIAYC